MRLSVEVYLMIEFSVTAALLALAVHAADVVRPGRIILAALMSAISSALILAGSLNRVLALATMPFSVFIALGWSGRDAWLSAFGWCALLASAFAGFSMLVMGRLPIQDTARVPLLMAAFFALVWRMGKSRRLPKPTIRMRVSTRIGTAEITALVDTGNLLREPFSGQPVLIVCAERLVGALDSAQLLQSEETALTPGFRIVCYHALGGGGRMRCFRPESIRSFQDGRWVDVPGLWVGIYRGRLPGGVSALAPACCAEGKTGGKRGNGR